MALQDSVTYEYFTPESRWDSGRHHYAVKSLTSSVSGIALNEEPGGTFSIGIGLNKQHDANIVEQVKASLRSAGFQDIKSTEIDNTTAASVEASNVKPQDLIKAALAIGLDGHAATQMVEGELKRQNISPSEAGLVAFKVQTIAEDRQRGYGLEHPVSYISADIAHPHAAVSQLREDAYPAGVGDNKTLMDIRTRIEIRPGNSAAVKQALEAANIKFENEGNGPVVFAAAPADGVAEALGKSNLLPASVAREISTKAETAHPGQRQINEQVREASAKFLAGLNSKTATFASAAPAQGKVQNVRS